MNHKEREEILAWIGIDWADEKHAVCEYCSETGKKQHYAIPHGGEALQDWINQLRERYSGKRVAVVLEQARGGLIYALMDAEFMELYPVNPQSLARFRKALYPSGAKNDPPDAELLEEMVRHNPERFRVWKPADSESRSLRMLTESRRKLVDQMVSLTNQLTSTLKTYYPQAVKWAGELNKEQASAFLEKWPSLAELQNCRPYRIRAFYQRHGRPNRELLDERIAEIASAKPLTSDDAIIQASMLMVQALVCQIRPLRMAIEKFEQEIERVFQQHPDRTVFKSFPGAGKALAPRLTAIFGADRERFQAAAEMEQFSGIAPVTERSGKKIWIHRRWACSKFVLQTFHEFANQSWKFCDWARAYYQQQISRGKSHQAAVRALAYKWIRIMFRCWKDRLPYDDARYVQSLSKRGSRLAERLEAQIL